MNHVLKTMFVVAAFLQSAFSIHAQEFLSAVPTTISLVDALSDDIYIKPSSATASVSDPGEGIERSFDRDVNTFYRTSMLPATLDYTFDNTVTQIDYFIYYPAFNATMAGYAGQIEVWYAANGQPMTKYGDYNFNGSDQPSTVVFQPAILNPETIRIVLKTGRGNSATCAEMEFYRKGSVSFDPQDIFTDASCSEIKEGVTIDDIKAIPREFYRKLASDIYYGIYDSEFRVQEYKAYQNPDIIAKTNKTSRYGRSDGVTGIYVASNTDLILLLETASNEMPVLFVHNDATAAGGNNYSLRKGLNKIKIVTGGLMYIRYYTQTGTEPPAKINIVNGTVNGYYDKSRHTPADWPRLLAKATHSLFQLKGDYVMMCFNTSVFRSVAKTTGPELLDAYDEMVYLQMEFQGMVKYNKMFNTRLCLFVDPDPNIIGWMYATDYYTGYQPGSQSDILNVTKFKSGSSTWGPAHEAGHVNQTRPGLKWLGTTEVTNNILSQHIVTYWGGVSRLQQENHYAKGISGIVNAGNLSNYLQHSDVFVRLVPFWQLKLYMIDALGKEDFYKDLYEKVRVNPNPVAKNGCTIDAMCQLEFVRLVCEVSRLDMTDFFTDWKFLTPGSFSIDDYGTALFTISQQGLDALKAEIAAMGLPKPPVPDGKKLYEINDSNWKSYIPSIP